MPDRDRFPRDVLERLVTRILSGQTVFFIGAGFSLDSEGNKPERLVARLLARFLSMVKELDRAEAAELQHGLQTTFDLNKEDVAGEKGFRAAVTQLASQYYYINEWISNAYGSLLEMLPSAAGERVAMEKKILAREAQLLAVYEPGWRYTPQPFHTAEYGKLNDAAGKALFLDTLGFRDPAVMAGTPRHPDAAGVRSSYGNRLKDRHDVLARLAREGLCPLLLTTNYDLLLEGACRLAGFQLLEVNPRVDRTAPPSAYGHLSRIAGPSDFFEAGAGYRSALLVKIHGCVDRYRDAVRQPRRWEEYLPSMVFTYREVQNWRKDSWSRDLVSTLLRTRTIVLCGYGIADPVVHDTFRTVYEEASTRWRETSERPATGKTGPEEGRAFFTGHATKCEFNGLEVLRAASRAAGCTAPPLATHPNYIPFHYGGEGKFPTLDENMVWVFHRTFRRLQTNALATDLRRSLQLLVGPLAEAQLGSLRRQFQELLDAETELAGTWDTGARSRWQFRRTTGWTRDFHTALLREFALEESALRNQSPGRHLDRLRAQASYYPALDQPGWTAWGAVIEIAARKMAAVWRGAGEPWTKGVETLEVARCDWPVILFSKDMNATPSPVALVLHTGTAPSASRLRLRGAYRNVRAWPLLTVKGKRGATTPYAAQIWKAALGKPDLDDLKGWFGEGHGRIGTAA